MIDTSISLFIEEYIDKYKEFTNTHKLLYFKRKKQLKELELLNIKINKCDIYALLETLDCYVQKTMNTENINYFDYISFCGYKLELNTKDTDYIVYYLFHDYFEVTINNLTFEVRKDTKLCNLIKTKWELIVPDIYYAVIETIKEIALYREE